MSSTGQKRQENFFEILRRSIASFILALSINLPLSTQAQVPAVIHYQGRVLASGIAFEGSGQFKFALVNANASETYWRNAPDVNADDEPDSAVTVPVTRGLYSVLLGDTSLLNMAILPNNLFNNTSVYLRVWFTDGQGNFERLVPDQRIVAVGYAMIASTVSDGAVTLDKLASDARGAIQSAASNTRADSLQSQITALTARLDGLSLSQVSTPSGLTAASVDPADMTLLAQGFVAFNSTTPALWVNGASLNTPSPRLAHTAVWTGDSWIVWGGDLGGVLSDAGAIYQPSVDAWTPVASFGRPDARNEHTAIWTGQQMIIWGGHAAGVYLNTGGKFQLNSQEWTPTTTVSAPAGRVGHAAVWTGSRLLIWGGLNNDGLLNDGALYDPATDQWTPLALPNPPEARQGAACAWAGDRLILWGGTGANGSLNSGAQLLFAASGGPIEWRAMNLASAPSARANHSLVWTGQKAIVWGGKSNAVFIGDGAAYDPTTDTWQPLASTQIPSARAEHGAIWTGTEMLILNGDSASGALATGAAYDPAANRWRTLNNGGNPLPRIGATTTWTGSEALVFGGHAGVSPIASLQRLNPQPAFTFYRKP